MGLVELKHVQHFAKNSHIGGSSHHGALLWKSLPQLLLDACSVLEQRGELHIVPWLDDRT